MNGNSWRYGCGQGALAVENDYLGRETLTVERAREVEDCPFGPATCEGR